MIPGKLWDKFSFLMLFRAYWMWYIMAIYSLFIGHSQYFLMALWSRFPFQKRSDSPVPVDQCVTKPLHFSVRCKVFFGYFKISQQPRDQIKCFYRCFSRVIMRWLDVSNSLQFRRIIRISLGYLCNIWVEPTTNCNSNETYLTLFHIYSYVTY